MKVTIFLSPKRVAWILTIVGCLTFLAALTGDILGHFFDPDKLWPITRQFDFSEEGNYANWYESVTLLLCAVLLATIASVTKKMGGRYRRHWIGLAVVFLFVSIDEAAQIHETTVSILVAQVRHYFREKKIATAEGSPTGANQSAAAANPRHESSHSKGEDSPNAKTSWIPIYLGVMAVLTLVYLRFFFALAPRIRFYFALAAVLYLGGAVGVERLVYAPLSARYGDAAFICQLVTNISELMEMLGVAVFVYPLLTYLGQLTEEFAVRVGEKPPVP